MLQAMVVTLREGIEAFLIVAITLSYLRKTGRGALARPVYVGIAVSVLSSIVAGYLFSLANNRSLWEACLALFAAVLVGTLVIHMWRTARHLRARIHERIETAASGSGRGAWFGVFLFTVLMITREGMETALLLGTLLFQMKAARVAAGALLGLAAAAALAWLWGRYGHRVDLRTVLQVTAVFLLVFTAQLLIYGFHELAEAGVLPASTMIHDATEAYGPDGVYGHWLSLALVLIPGAWFLFSRIVSLTGPSVDPGRVYKSS